MMLSVILLSTLMILLSNLGVSNELIFGNKQSWLLNLNLTYETRWNGERSGLLNSIQEKRSLFYLALMLLMWKWMGVFLRKSNILKFWDFLCLLNWIGGLKLFLLLKLLPRKLESLFVRISMPTVSFLAQLDFRIFCLHNVYLWPII